MEEMKKRYQECNKLEKLWRMRWYLTIPFSWFWYIFCYNKRVYIDELQDGKIIHTEEFEILKGKRLWKLLIGDIQGSNKMNYVWTIEEVQEKFKNKGYANREKNG